MIVIVANKETDQKHAYFDVDRILNETIFKKSIFILEGYDKNANPSAKIFHKNEYEISEAVNDRYSIADEETVKEMLREDGIVIHNYI